MLVDLINPAPALMSRPQGAAALHLRLIGNMTARTPDGENILPLGRKTRALLAILALSAPRPVVRSRLAELLWSRRLEEQARASLRQEIHRLLEALYPIGSDIVRVTRDHLALRPELVWVDVEEVARATPENPASLSLLDNRLLDEFDGLDPALDAWLDRERSRVRDRARSVAQTLLDERATPGTVLSAAQRLISIDPAHESAWRAVMRAHAALGERGLAIQAYERCRTALADMMDAQPSIDTKRLIAEIRAGSVQLPAAPEEPARAPVRNGARLGMLPLHSIDGGTGETALSIGLAEEVTAALARFRWLTLVSTSALALSGTRDEAALRRNFGLDFLLDGSVQRVGRKLRVAMRLLDLREGNQMVWARRFDAEGDDALALQDEVAAEIVAQLDPEVLLIEGRRAAQLPVDTSSAYQLTLRALPLMARLRRDDLANAGDLLARALEKEPDYAAAHAWRAYWAVLTLTQGWADRPAELTALARDSAERSITLDPQDARALTIAGHVRAYLFRRPREGLELHGRALSLNPNLAMAWGLSAASYVYLGELDEAARRFARYKRLSPMDPDAFLHDTNMVRLELCRRNYNMAVQLGRRATELNPFYSPGLQNHLAALGHAGLAAEATANRQRLFNVEPGFTVQTALGRNPYQQPEAMAHFAEGLRLAGVPEGSDSQAAAE